MRSALLFLLLCGCGGGGTPGTQAECPTNPVKFELVDSIVGLGSCDRCRGDGWTYCKVLRTLPPDLLVRVVAHELGHAAGLAHDFDGSGCIMDQDVGHLCGAEIHAMSLLRYGKQVIEVYPSAEAHDAVVDAVALWHAGTVWPVFGVN